MSSPRKEKQLKITYSAFSKAERDFQEGIYTELLFEQL